MVGELDQTFVGAVLSNARVSGLTHAFYRYPARFSPEFARAAILRFTKPGDVVFDPFMGGGTTLVEAAALGRRAIGTDLNSLSVFASRVKTTVLDTDELAHVETWVRRAVRGMNLRRPPIRDERWANDGYQRNASCRHTWPIRKAIELALADLPMLRNERCERFARCVLLRAAQWALDCREHIPAASELRAQILSVLDEMLAGATDFATAAGKHQGPAERAICIHRSAASVASLREFEELTPALIVTSPPYPGVHVLYHRWQVQGSRETPAPFWIAGSLDGEGASFYTFGDRKQKGLSGYYKLAAAAFESIAKVVSRRTVVVQMIAFSDPSWQLPLYLGTMESAGFIEQKMSGFGESHDGRLWRDIPNRKFYADQRGATEASKEVVLFHRLK